MIDEVAKRLEQFDIVHFHVDFLHYPMMRAYADRILTTLHGRLDLPDTPPFYRAFPELPLVSISNAQRAPMPPVNWLSTIYHGLPKDLLPFNPAPASGYAAFLGRISPEKRPDRAIEMAARAGIHLKIAAKVDQADRKYWDEIIGPMVAANPNVEFIGEINEHQKADFLGNASALLFPIDWPEPFGLVMIEAMACGTPVIAFANGSVPEIIDDGLTGFIVASMDDAAAALQSIDLLPRAAVRRQFEERFTVERMTQDYLAAYRRLRPDVRPALELVSA
jgi:glycosyltransferase involved in cell wall biosynthesis